VSVEQVLWQRIISAALGIPLAVGISYAGGNWLRISVGIIILLGLYEYGSMMRRKGYRPSFGVLLFSGLFIIAAFIYPHLAQALIFIIICTHALGVVFGKLTIDDISLSLLGVLIVGWTLGHLILVRGSSPQGFYELLLCFLISWSTDTGAYFSGRFWGRHKLSPLISPNKTVEGAMGGTVLCVIVVFSMQGFLPSVPILYLLLVGASASLAGQVGDLLESAVKRWAGVKDSGSLIPGHGGILDRFDSLTLVAPLVYYFLTPFISHLR